MIEKIYQTLPEQIRGRFEDEASYLGKEVDKQVSLSFIAGMITLPLIMTYFLGFNPLLMVLWGLVGFFSGPAIYYLYLLIKVEEKMKRMERNIPDALKLVSSNLKSGQTLEESFIMSARDEFEPFASELKLTAKEIYAGKPPEDSLGDMKGRIKSGLFKETLKLLIDGLRSGGDKASLLRTSAEDIEQSLELRNEIKSSVRMYSIFIVLVACIGAPILFSISVQLSESTTEIWGDAEFDETQGMDTSAGIDLTFEEPDVDVELFRNFTFFALIVINNFAALIIAEIRTGKVRNGLKFGPFLTVLSIGIFLVTDYGVSLALETFIE